MSDPVTESSRYASRKFAMGLLVLAIGAGLDANKLLSPLLVELMKWTFAIYCGFNVTQKAAEWLADAISTKKDPE